MTFKRDKKLLSSFFPFYLFCECAVPLINYYLPLAMLLLYRLILKKRFIIYPGRRQKIGLKVAEKWGISGQYVFSAVIM